jgi:uncharacterized cupredoxin-like copper-binding protein
VVVALITSGCGTKRAEPRSVPNAVVIPVILGDLAIEPRRFKLRAEKVQFQVTNRGTVDRDFQIPTLETHHGHEQHLLKPGETKALEYDLTPGTHEVVCTTPGHQEAVMTASLEVFP